MTADEIIKALDYCVNKGYCPECPNYAGCEDCKIGCSAIDLINRQKAEIENYKKIAEYQQSCNMARWFEIERLKEEIERLKSNKHGGIVH